MKRCSELERKAVSMAVPHPRLQTPERRFVLLGASGEGLKKPFEDAWQETANYQHDDPKLTAHRGNYGVCGGFGDLHIVDCDDLARWQELEVLSLVPTTFTIESRPGHRQYYLLCKEHFHSGGLFDPEKKELNKEGKLAFIHIGDLKAGSKDGICGGQAVGPGCKHPSGSIYQVIVDAPIAEVSGELLQSIISRFKTSKKVNTNFQKAEGQVKAARQRRYEEKDPLDVLQVVDIMPPEDNVRRSGDELRGDHPVHGSKNGGNYVINTAKNVWHCKRCESGGGAAAAIAVRHGLISCSEAGPGELRGDLFRQVLKIAKDKYGMAGNGNGGPRTRGDEAGITIGFEELTEGGNASRLERICGEELRYCHTFKKWYIWQDGRWQLDIDEGANRIAAKVVNVLYTEAANADGKDARKAIANFAMETDSRKGIANMLALAGSRLTFTTTANKLDSDPWTVGAGDVTIDLKTGNTRKSCREDLITKAIGAKYDRSGQCPLWEKFLDRIFAGDKELIAYIKRAFGYCLTGSMAEQVFFFCHGDGSNGKTKFLIVLRGLLRDYAKQADFSTFLVQRNEKVRNDLAALAGARVITAIEAEEGSRLSMSVIKAWTGGDPVTARFLFAENFTFQPTGKLWLAANNKPAISERNHAAWRRVQLIPFNVTIPEAEQDKEIEFKLLKELPGILNWALAGLADYLKVGLKTPKAVQAATAKYRQENDSLEEFLSECCDIAKLKVCKNTDLYGAYLNFCGMSGLKAISQTKFSPELNQRPDINSTKTKPGIVWTGIDLKKEWVFVGGDGLKSSPISHTVAAKGDDLKQNAQSPLVEANSGDFAHFTTNPSPDSDSEMRKSPPPIEEQAKAEEQHFKEVAGKYTKKPEEPEQVDACEMIKIACFTEYGNAGVVDPRKIAAKLKLPLPEGTVWLDRQTNYLKLEREGTVFYRQKTVGEAKA